MCKEKNCNCGDEVTTKNCGCDDNANHRCGCGENSEHESCGCGCGCGEDTEPLIVELEDENGNIIACEVVDGFEYEDKEYAVLINPEDESYYIFEVVGNDEDGDMGELVVPSEEEFETLKEYYEELLATEEEEEEEE